MSQHYAAGTCWVPDLLEERLPFGKRVPVDPAEYCAANPDSQTFVCEFGILKRPVPCSGASASFLDDLAGEVVEAADEVGVGATFETLAEDVTEGAMQVVDAADEVGVGATFETLAEDVTEGAMEVVISADALNVAQTTFETVAEQAGEAVADLTPVVEAAAETVVEVATEVQAAVEAAVAPEGFTDPPYGFEAVHQQHAAKCTKIDGEVFEPAVFVRRLGGEHTFEEAEAACGAVGGRLCTVAEAWDGCAGLYSGWGYDIQLVWTSGDSYEGATCPAGEHIATLGMGNDATRAPASPECAANSMKLKAQCCVTRLVE